MNPRLHSHSNTQNQNWVLRISAALPKNAELEVGEELSSRWVDFALEMDQNFSNSNLEYFRNRIYRFGNEIRRNQFEITICRTSELFQRFSEISEEIDESKR